MTTITPCLVHQIAALESCPTCVRAVFQSADAMRSAIGNVGSVEWLLKGDTPEWLDLIQSVKTFDKNRKAGA